MYALRSFVSRRRLSGRVGSWGCAVVLLFSGGAPTYAGYCCEWTEVGIGACPDGQVGAHCNAGGTLCCSNEIGRTTCTETCEGLFYEGKQCNTSTFVCDTGQTGIPAVSEWGLIAMALLVLMAGTLLFRSHEMSHLPKSRFIRTAA